MAEVEVDPTVEATLRASRALLGVVARSVAPVLDQVSLAQFRVRVLLAATVGSEQNSRIAVILHALQERVRIAPRGSARG